MASTASSTRLYMGNLSDSVDEYALMQLCSPHGKIVKLDYLFHKSGPQKGKPRGYAFIQYERKEEASRAILALNQKLVRGKRITVTPASMQTEEQLQSMTTSSRGRGGSKMGEGAPRTTAISLLKGQGMAGAAPNRKIAALEAKLEALRQSKSASGSPAASPAPDTVNESLNTQDGATDSKPIRVDSAKAGLPPKPNFKGV